MDNALFGKSAAGEFVGVAALDTIGLVSANLDPGLRGKMGLPAHVRAVGTISSRTGAAGQILAVDEALKATRAELITVELPRDTKGWGGHGCYILIGSDTVSDVRRAVEIALSLIDKHCGEVYISEAGHLEFAYSAGAGEALHRAFSAPIGRAFGFMAASPASIGLIMADRALKSSNVTLIDYGTPDHKTSHSNEVMIWFSGETSDTKNAVLTARECGYELLCSLGSTPKSPGESYIK